MIKKEKQRAIVTLLITGLTFGILCMAAVIEGKPYRKPDRTK